MNERLPCGNYIHAALSMIRDELDRVMWNIHQEEYSSPFGNTGNEFDCDVFKVKAYDWGKDMSDDADMPWNFKWKDVEIQWYKYLGRGMTINRLLSPSECSEMLDECIDSLQMVESASIEF